MEYWEGSYPRILEFKPMGKGIIHLRFESGHWVEVDLHYLIDLSDCLQQLADDAFLATGRIEDEGWTIVWTEDIDQPADNLWLRGVPAKVTGARHN